MITTLAFAGDGSILVSGSADGSITIWPNPYITNSDSPSTRCSPSKESHLRMLHSVRWIPRLSWVGHSQPITALAISFDGNVAATGSSDGSIRTWHTKLGMCSTIITDFLQAGPENYRRVLAVTLSEDVSMLSGSFSETEGTIAPWAPDYVALVWTLNARSGCNSSSPPKAALIGHEDVVTSACFHPLHQDGRQLLTASRDSTIKLWDVPSRRCLYSFRTHTPVAQVAFASNAEFISYKDVGGTVKVFTYSK